MNRSFLGSKHASSDPSQSCAATSGTLLQDLFVLEMAGNHWGSVERAREIVRQHSHVAAQHAVKCAIKLQLRHTETFIHPAFAQAGAGVPISKLSGASRYVQKTHRTKLSLEDTQQVVDAINASGCVPLATVFDEPSVRLLVDLNLPAIKIASSDLSDWHLLGLCAETGKPIILSTGGHSLGEIAASVDYLREKGIAIAVNHCVSRYPSENIDLQLDQIDVLRQTFPDLVIGLSTHEYGDWHSSMLISYGKGVRTWERHIDIPYPAGHEQQAISPYCSTPAQIGEWFAAYATAKEMCGEVPDAGREIGLEETNYLKALKRGAYLRRDVAGGQLVTRSDFFFAIPLQSDLGQLSSAEVSSGSWRIKQSAAKDSPVTAALLERVPSDAYPLQAA